MCNHNMLTSENRNGDLELSATVHLLQTIGVALV
jgi:hypothetical protein